MDLSGILCKLVFYDSECDSCSISSDTIQVWLRYAVCANYCPRSFLVAFFPLMFAPRSFGFFMFVQLPATPRFAATELDWGSLRIEIAAAVLFPTFFSRCTSSSFLPLLLLAALAWSYYSLSLQFLSLLLSLLPWLCVHQPSQLALLQKSFITTIYLPLQPSDSFPIQQQGNQPTSIQLPNHSSTQWPP